MDPFQDILDSLDMHSAEMFQPAFILSGSGVGWFYSDTKRTMVKVARGSECVIFDKDPYSEKKVIVQIGNELLSVPEEELVEIGWN